MPSATKMILKSEHQVDNSNVVRSLVPRRATNIKAGLCVKLRQYWGAVLGVCQDRPTDFSEEQYSDNGTVHHEEIMGNAIQFCKEQLQ